MNAQSTAYEVGFRITEYRSVVVHAASPAEALAKAQELRRTEPESELFEVTTNPDSDWRADEMEL